jgi:hypothetical protein
VERQRKKDRGQNKRGEIDERHTVGLKQIETNRRDKGETGGETEEKVQKRETEDQRYRGEREVERKIGEIHRV